MNIKNKIITKQLLYAVMLLFMMIWTCGAWAQNATSQEKLLYSTDFTDWDDIDRKVTVNKEVKLKTQFSDEDLTFTLNGVGADPKGTQSKFPSYTGYMITAKYLGEYKKAEPSAVTSPLKSITKIVLTQAATGGKRGIKVSVKGDGDEDWVALHNETIANSKGETLTIDVNRTNCQIKFENFALDQNAYIVDLEIYGYSDGEEKKVRTLEFPLQDGIVGKYPSKIKCDNDGYAVMPEGNGFYRPDYTFVAWTDGTNDYTPGEKYQFTKDVTRIKPKMKENTYHLYDANKETTIVWPFDHSEAPTLNVFQENAQKDLSYTRPAEIYIDKNTKETQDVALNINVKNGKIDNTDDRINALPGKGAVVRNGTAFTLPAIYGMKVSIKASEKVDSDNGNLKTIFGTANDNVQIKLKDTANKDSLTLKNAELSADGKTVTFTYRGDEPTITLTTFVNKGSKYDYWHFESITATYPLLPNVVCNNTITNADPENFPNEKAINAGDYKVELKDPTATSHANIGTRFKVDDVVMITPTAKYGYDFAGIVVDGTTYTTIPDEGYEYKVKDGISNIEVRYTRKEMHKITIKPSDPNLGTVTLEPKHDYFYNETRKVGADGKPGNITQVESWFTPGTTVIASGEAIIDNMLDYWKEGDTTVKEGYTYEFTTDDKDHTYTAHFREGNVGNIIFDFGNERVNGAAEKDNYKGAESKLFTKLKNIRSFTIATNYTFFKSVDKDGKLNPNFYTLDHWTIPSDTTQHYEFGKHYSFGTESETITLVPVFRENPTNTENRSNAPIIRYDFGRKVHKYRGPTSGVLRNVCAPTINIGSNQKFFWTTQAYIETYESGKKYNYRRDIAMWCDTGANGYIRNTDFDDWAEFGPNTTFWLIAGVGTEIRLLTYSPITTTTIDGVVPTLDKARTDSVRKVSGKKYMYVYTHTTQSTADRIPLVIGDDHTYYQWLEIHMQAANWVNLYTNVDHQNRGSIKEINVSETSEFKDFHRTEDGKGYSFRKGERVKLTFNRKKGYVFDKIVDLNNPDSDGKEFTITKKDKPSYSSTDSLRTEYTVEFDITDHRNLQIQFKETPTFHITYNPGQLASGTAPEAAWVEPGDRFTIPTNKTLYYEGNTLDHWVDENNNTFAIGKEYKAVGKDRRLFPVFKPNEFNLLDIIESGKTATATWKFAKNDGAPDINYEKTAGILVTQLKYGDKSIDMKLYLDGSQGGKFNNMSSTNTKRIQINANSILWFPATPGCTATLTASSTSDKKEKRVKIEDDILPLKDKVITKDNCKADSAYLKMDFLDGHYFKEFSVTYKHQTATLATIESLTWSYDGTKQTGTIDAKGIKQQMKDNGCITFTIRPWENGETMPKLSGTASEGGSVEVTTAILTNPECEVKVKTKSGVDVETYPVKFEFEDPGDTPVIESVTINDTTYPVEQGEKMPTFTVKDLPFNGVIKVKFNRTMKQPDQSYNFETNNTGKELVLNYWDLPNHDNENLEFMPGDSCFMDIYGKECQQTLILNLTAMDAAVYYHHHNFNFVVGKDGDIDEAIKAANGKAEGKPYNNDKNDGHRYYIFVPDGEYKLTGNGTISWTGDDDPKDEEGKKRPDMNGKNNGQTHIRKSNISIIGQSKDNTIIRNHPTVEGISYTATLCVENNNTDFYAEDLTLENEFDYWGSMAGQSSGTGAGRADVFFDRGNRSILKNVALKSWQDTYYSNNASSDFRGYFENCDFYGAVDFICGNGNIWFEKCNLILRDRKSNNIVAPSTEVDQEWGYVFNECSIKPESDNMTKFTDKDWTLARAWGNSPACTYLNTKMYTQPQSYGWGRSMESNLKLRFHEYNSTDATGNILSIVRRSIAAGSPAAGSDDVILSEEQANKYTLRDVVGGSDGFEPNELCMQIDAASGAKADHDENNEVWNDNISLEDNMMVWNTNQKALCYVVFKLDKETGKWEYIDNTTATCFYLTTEHGTGDYCVRAANQRGGLGAATKAIRYEWQEPYKLEIKKVGEYKEEGKDYGWSTICLPFNARVPKEVKVYAATAHDKETADYKVEDFVMTLTPVEIIDSLKGYVVYGPVGTYSFAPTSHKGGTPTILTGNPTAAAISSTNINCYVLAYKTWGLGFYKYTGATLAANRAWLPQDMVSNSNQEDLALGKRGISFVISDPTTGISHPVYTIQSHDDAIYNLNGQRVKSPTQPGIYISRGKGKVIRK